MQEKDKKKSKLFVSTFTFFITGLVLIALWNVFLAEEIKRSGIEKEGLKKDMEKIEALQNANRNFTKDVLRQKAISLCFFELIKEYEEIYTGKEKQDCIQFIAMIDEKYRDKGLDAPLILAWLEKESDGNPRAVSYAGAKGLTQLMDFRAEEILSAMGYPGYQSKLVFNPVINLTGGLHHLVALMNFWEMNAIKNRSLILFYALHSYKWGTKNTVQLFNSERRAFRPAIEYVNWILNRRENWVEKLESRMNDAQ